MSKQNPASLGGTAKAENGSESEQDLETLRQLAPLEQQVEEAFFERADEEAFWWSFSERMDALEKARKEWDEDDTTDLPTREKRRAVLQGQIDDMADLGRKRVSKVEPLKRGYLGATVKQRKSWARGEGPNLLRPPDIMPETLERIRHARDELLREKGRAPRKSVAAKAHVAESTVQRYLPHLE